MSGVIGCLANFWEGLKRFFIDLHLEQLTPFLVEEQKINQSSIDDTSIWRSNSNNDNGVVDTKETDDVGAYGNEDDIQNMED